MKRILLRACVAAAFATIGSCRRVPTVTVTPEPSRPREANRASDALPPLRDVDPDYLPVVRATLGVPPRAAPAIDRAYSATVVVELEVREMSMPLADGATYTFWTFGGTVPGPMIRVRRGDWVQLHLMNHPNNTMPHNIDLHAVTGPGGGAEPTFTPPGHQSQFTFRAQSPGIYMYHCATAPVGMHIANGMYGMIVVEPEEGWPHADREYYVVQSEVYTGGNYRDRGAQTFDMNRAVHEDPSYVVFNGRDGALTGDNALSANVGETVRLFVGNGGPNLVSSFHVIGEIFDRVYPEGASQPVSNVQTTLVPAGGATMVEFHTEVPGNYPLVDHSIFRTFNKGALAMLRVGGPPNRALYSGRESDLPYDGHGVAAAVSPHHVAPVADGAPGENTFNTVCAACHQRTGLGVGSIFPPLAESDFLMADRERAIRVVLGGLSGPVQVRGQTFNGMMPSQAALLNDRQVADVLSYVRSNFGNHGDPIREAEVANVRRQLASTATP